MILPITTAVLIGIIALLSFFITKLLAILVGSLLIFFCPALALIFAAGAFIYFRFTRRGKAKARRMMDTFNDGEQ